MPAYSSPVDVSALLVAKHAEWAGDFEFLAVLYERVVLRGELNLTPEYRDGPIGLICEVVTARLRHTIQALEIAKVVRIDTRRMQVIINDHFNPLTIRDTPHMRGVVRRTGVRDFELRAYLADLKWQKNLRTASVLLAKEQGDTRRLPESVAAKKLNYTWIARDDLDHVVNVSPMGMIKARLTWTQPSLPDPRKLVDIFAKTLMQIEHTALPPKS